MPTQYHENLKIVRWRDVRDRVAFANPSYAQLLEELRPSDDAKLVYAAYPFGVDFFSNGNLFLPWNNGGVISVTDPQIPYQISSMLRYSRLPVGIILSKTVEVFYSTYQRVIPDKLWSKGTLLGVWEQVDEANNMNTARFSNLSSGARLIFMLQKITDGVSHQRLQREFNITTPMPNNLFEQRDLFAKLIHSTTLGLDWRCEIIFLPQTWLQPKSKYQQLMLQNFMLMESWRQSFNCRKQFEHHVEWEEVLNLANSKNIVIQPSIINQINHLFAIGEGIYPGLSFVTEDNDDVAPTALIQALYRNVYQLRGQAPLMMCPDYIAVDNPVYYSLNFPNYFLPYLNRNSSPRLMDELRSTKTTLEILQQHQELQNKYHFDYFNTTPDEANDIASPAITMQLDKRVMKYFEKYNHEKFPSNSPFFKSCIRVNKKTT